MRWLLQRGASNDESQLLTLRAAPDEIDDTPAGIASLPSGALAITVRSAEDARATLAELQRVQRQLLTARTRAAGGGALSLGSNVVSQVRRQSRHIRRAKSATGRATRGFRRTTSTVRVRTTSTAIFDGLDAALLFTQSAEGIDEALKLVGAAIEAVGGAISDLDLGDFDFD